MFFVSPVLAGESKDQHPTSVVFCHVPDGAEKRDYFTWSREVQRCVPGRRYLL